MTHPLQQYYSRIYKRYDLVNRLFTFGLDQRWRRDVIRLCLQGNPEKVLDLCCGTGDLAIGIRAAANGEVDITGYDFNPLMLGKAVEKAKNAGFTQIRFLEGDAGAMPFPDGGFDRITIGFGFRNLTWENPEADTHLHEMSRVLKPGGQLLILESSVPSNALVEAGYRLYLKLVLVPLGGLLSGDWNAYRYLAGSSSGFYTFETLREMMSVHHFRLEKVKSYLFGSANLLVATRITA
jgi:demethylmenaquinone methyltransferase/2-methoxy-6-polyprenyl-1,4-benzoquinol methylase